MDQYWFELAHTKQSYKLVMCLCLYEAALNEFHFFLFPCTKVFIHQATASLTGLAYTQFMVCTVHTVLYVHHKNNMLYVQALLSSHLLCIRTNATVLLTHRPEHYEDSANIFTAVLLFNRLLYCQKVVSHRYALQVLYSQYVLRTIH